MTIEIANRLVALRKNKGLSQEELAEKLGVSRQAVSKWERAEASPDLEKLIALSKLYGITLDELLLERQEASDERPASYPNDFRPDDTEEEKDSEDEKEQPACDKTQNINDARESEYEEKFEAEESQKPKNSVHINWKDGIHVKGEDGDEVHISWKGIHVEECGGDSVHVGPQGIYVEEQEGNRVDVSGSGVFVNGQPVKNNPWFRFPYPLVALGLFLGWGFSGLLGGWAVAWLSFLTIPLYYSAVDAVRHRQASKFCYPVLALLAFLAWGFWGGLGGFALSWICFLTIPFYYLVCRLSRRQDED